MRVAKILPVALASLAVDLRIASHLTIKSLP
jgi:hypothetical protein